MKDGRRYAATWNGIAWPYLTGIFITFMGLMSYSPNSTASIEGGLGPLNWWYSGFSSFYEYIQPEFNSRGAFAKSYQAIVICFNIISCVFLTMGIHSLKKKMNATSSGGYGSLKCSLIFVAVL